MEKELVLGLGGLFLLGHGVKTQAGSRNEFQRAQERNKVVSHEQAPGAMGDHDSKMFGLGESPPARSISEPSVRILDLATEALYM